MMKVTYIFGYYEPEELDVESIRAENSFLILSCFDGNKRAAHECIVHEDGKMFAHLSENA